MGLLNLSHLYDYFGGENSSAYPLDDKAKGRLFRQGLLEFAANVSRPNGGNLANSIATGLLAANHAGHDGAHDYVDTRAHDQDIAAGNLRREAATFSALPQDQRAAAYPTFAQHAQAFGIPFPPQYDPQMDASIANIGQALGTNGGPTDVQSFNYFASGLSPEDAAKARRIQLGLDPRAVTGAMKAGQFTGSDGRPRPTRFNPTTGKQEVYYDEDGRWITLGQPSLPPPQPSYAPSGNVKLPDGSNAYFDPNMPAQDRATAWNDATGNTGAPVTLPPQPIAAPPRPMPAAQPPQANALPPPLDYRNGGMERVPGLGVGRTAEEEAGAVERAKQQAQIDMAGGQANAQGNIEAGKQQGQDAAKAFDQLQQSGAAAIKEKARLVELRNLLKTTYTGPGADTVLGMKRAANALGIDVKGLGEAEAARALSNQLALSLRNPAGGEGMPGAMSDSDRAFLQQSVPSLNNTPQGWRAMIDMRLALADYAVKQAQYADQLRRSMTPIRDIPGMVQDWANAHPIFEGGDSSPAPANGDFSHLWGGK